MIHTNVPRNFVVFLLLCELTRESDRVSRRGKSFKFEVYVSLGSQFLLQTAGGNIHKKVKSKRPTSILAELFIKTNSKQQYIYNS